MANTKRNLFVAGSIAASVLFAGAFTANTTHEATQAIVSQRTTASESSLDLDTTGSLTAGNYSDVMFWSNMPDYTANGFNLASYQAVLAYQNETAGDLGYVQTASYDDTGEGYAKEILATYANQKAEGNETQTILTSGFQVANTYMGSDYADLTYVDYDGIWGQAEADGSVKGHESEYIVLLDDNLLGSTYKNAVSVQYAAEGAGFSAGIAASLYTIGNAASDEDLNNGTPENYGDDNQNIVMWGGFNYPTVYSFMSGFAQAVTWVNGQIPEMAHITLWSGGDYSDKTISEANTYGTSDAVDANTWYTWGFNGGTGTASNDPADVKLARQKTENAVKAGASIVFPIAGGQTGTALSYIAGQDTTDVTTRVIGVDTDNTVDYAANADLIIGSATKSLVDGGFLGLASLNEELSTTYATEIAAWDTSADVDAKGTVLTGTIENGGVGFTYANTNGAALGINSDLAAAINTITGGAGAADAIATLDEAISSAISANGTISSSDDAFDTAVQPTSDSSSSLTWLWILLGVIAVASIVGALVYFLVLKKD